MPTIPFPSRRRREPPSSIPAIATLVPYKTTDGYWVFLAAGTLPPAGATAGALVAGTGYDTLLTTTSAGLRPQRNGLGVVFFL